jgi:hypothetical protein
VNLGEHGNDIRCKWVRRNYKKLAMRFHPDKYKGDNRARAQRKFREKADSKKHLEKEWGCKGGRGRR